MWLLLFFGILNISSIKQDELEKEDDDKFNEADSKNQYKLE